jgi:2-(3-amino-3-carboxypropyl)histidine synthase
VIKAAERKIKEKLKSRACFWRIMKTFFIEARHKGKIELPDGLVKILPAKVALFTTVQFLDSIEAVKKSLEAAGKKVLLMKPEHAKYPGQLLGCSIKKFDETKDGKLDAFLYIGDGEFHPKALMLKNDKPVFIYNPFSKKHRVLEEKDKDTEALKKKMMGALTKFIASKEIGVLISTKPGQNRMTEAYALEKKYPDKKFYFLAFDTIDFSELENFPFIECFVNTACPRIAYDDSEKIKKPILNIDDLEEIQ